MISWRGDGRNRAILTGFGKNYMIAGGGDGLVLEYRSFSFMELHRSLRLESGLHCSRGREGASRPEFEERSGRRTEGYIE